MPTTMSIQIESWNGIPVLLVSGEIDMSTAPRLGRALDKALAVGVPLIAELTGVGFIDSAGARILAMADHAATAHDTRLLIVASESVSRVLEITGLDRVLHVHGELHEALAAAREFVTRRAPGDA